MFECLECDDLMILQAEVITSPEIMRPDIQFLNSSSHLRRTHVGMTAQRRIAVERETRIMNESVRDSHNPGDQHTCNQSKLDCHHFPRFHHTAWLPYLGIILCDLTTAFNTSLHLLIVYTAAIKASKALHRYSSRDIFRISQKY